MMSGGRTAPLNPVRVEKAALFYNWSPFFALNTLNVIGSAVTLLLLWPAAQAAAAGGEKLSTPTTAAVRVGTRVTAVFVGALGAGSLVAGVAVGCKISHVARDAADLDATLRGAARAKLRKIAIAAAAFSGAEGCRAAVLYRAMSLAGRRRRAPPSSSASASRSPSCCPRSSRCSSSAAARSPTAAAAARRSAAAARRPLGGRSPASTRRRSARPRAARPTRAAAPGASFARAAEPERQSG